MRKKKKEVLKKDIENLTQKGRRKEGKKERNCKRKQSKEKKKERN